MFGRRKREEAAAAEVVREAERHALFAKLAERPEHICPFLGLEADRTGYVEGVSDDHRCFAFGDPAPISAEQQTRVCQERGYGNCPRYLRGVLVIPTEELEALRRPRAAADRPPPPPIAEPERRRRARSLVLGVLLLLVGAGGVGAFMLLGRDNGVAVTPTFTPSAVTTPSIRPTDGAQPTQSTPASATPTPTPVVLPSAGETIPPLPTPAPGSTQTGWIVVVTRGQFPVVRIDEDGMPGEQVTAVFSRVSGAPVDRLAIGGSRYWMTLIGRYARLAYVSGLSGEFAIFETWEARGGSVGFLRIPDDER